MKIVILDEAERDLLDGYRFYENREQGLGDYFLDTLFADIDSLLLFAGIHPQLFGKHRMLAKRFPFGIYYTIDGDEIRVFAILDLRRNPAWIRKRLDPQ